VHLFGRIREYFRKSFWLIPALMGLSSMAVFVVLFSREDLNGAIFSSTLLEHLNSRGLAATISSLLGALVVIFGILLPMIFSMLIRASSQFSAKVIQIYRYVLPPKFYFGLVLSSVLYFVVLLVWYSHFTSGLFLGISVAFAFVLFLLTVYSTPIFFNHFISILEPDYVIKMIVREIEGAMDRMDHLDSTSVKDEEMVQQDTVELEEGSTVVAKKSGYVQLIDFCTLVELFKKLDIQGVVPLRPGEYVFSGSILCSITGNTLSEKEYEQVQGCFSIDSKRLGISDLEFHIEDLLEILRKTLSQGGFDQATALNCVNYVGSVCNQLINLVFPTGRHVDDKGEMRIYSKEYDFACFVHGVFDTILQKASPHPPVLLHSLRILNFLIHNVECPGRAKVLYDISVDMYKLCEGASLSYQKEKASEEMKIIQAFMKQKIV